jgi:hypothetical protein
MMYGLLMCDVLSVYISDMCHYMMYAVLSGRIYAPCVLPVHWFDVD